MNLNNDAGNARWNIGASNPIIHGNKMNAD
nr:MAG TPA: hypothetical protein [Bacteriophage sp.]DAR52934.1 MAG TPA: hypothetical protein [Bacteriophage sp.]